VNNTRQALRFLTLKRTILLAALALPIGGPMAAAAQEKPVSKIEVAGEGSVDLAPDMAVLSIGVVREADTAHNALSDNSAGMTKVIEAMKAEGIKAHDLQTSNFNIQPIYSRERPKNGEMPKTPRIVGYRVSNNLTVRVRHLAKLGEIIDSSVTLGANTGGNIRFTNDDPEEAINKARANAMRNAMEKAEILVEAAGADLGPILEISENFSMPRPMPMAEARMMAADAAAPVPVEVGENLYKVTVRVVWEIAQ
jgi:uncharacterized protein